MSHRERFVVVYRKALTALLAVLAIVAPRHANAYTMTLSVTPSFTATGGNDATITAQVYTDAGQPASGVTVNFYADQWNTLTSSARTDSTGAATGSYGVVQPGPHEVDASVSASLFEGGASASAYPTAQPYGESDWLTMGLSTGSGPYRCCTSYYYYDLVGIYWDWSSYRTTADYRITVTGGSWLGYDDEASRYGSNGDNISACDFPYGSNQATATLECQFYQEGGTVGWTDTGWGYTPYFSINNC